MSRIFDSTIGGLAPIVIWMSDATFNFLKNNENSS